jgi:hypothetical protein
MSELQSTTETLEHPRSTAVLVRTVVAVVVAIVVLASVVAFAHHLSSSTPKVRLGSPRWTVGFDGGETASFQAPAGMTRTACCATSHVGLSGTGANAPTLDAYTDDSPNTVAHDLHALAVEESKYDARYDGKSGKVSYLTLDGHEVAQYTFTYRIHSTHPVREMATLMLIGHEELSLYWAQDDQHFSASVARTTEAAVVGSLRFGPSR